MSSRELLIDVAIAVVLAILVLTLTSGLAIAGLIALIVLAVCGISFLIRRRRHRTRDGGLRHHPSQVRRRVR